MGKTTTDHEVIKSIIIISSITIYDHHHLSDIRATYRTYAPNHFPTRELY